MADIAQTIDKYMSVCGEVDWKPNAFIIAVFNNELQRETKKGEVSVVMDLYLAGNNKLVTNDRLGNDDMLMLYKTLAENYYVVSLDLRYNCISDQGVWLLAKLLEETIALKSLNLMCNDFGEQGANYLATALKKNETLHTLRLTGNKIGNTGGMYFANCLQVNTTLNSLDLSDTDQGTSSMIAMATVLLNNATLKTLNVSRPLLFSQQEEILVHYAQMLKFNRGLTEIHLMKVGMTDFGITRLCDSLMENYTVRYLNISCNQVTQDGAVEIGKLLKRNTPLEMMDLSFNRISDDGALHLADALAGLNTTMTTLAVCSNEISGRGLCAIANCMRTNLTLTSVYIWGNVLQESACLAFSRLLDSGRLQPKETDVRAYTVDGVTYMAELWHGIRKSYYAGPAYGDTALPELKQFLKPITIDRAMFLNKTTAASVRPV